MKNSREEKGITLVALIITIVVLLILAGVAIGTVRDSDIIGYAKNASNSYEQARNNEISEIQSAEDLLEQYASQKNPWQQKGLTAPIEYDKKYTGPVAEGLGISTLTIKLGSDGKLIVEEAGINSTCNDSKITSITSNTITYNDDGDEIRIEYSADGKSAEVFYNNNKLGTIEVEKSTVTEPIEKNIEYYIPVGTSLQDETCSLFIMNYDTNTLSAGGILNQESVTLMWDSLSMGITNIDSELNITSNAGTNVTIENGDIGIYLIRDDGTNLEIGAYIKDNKIYFIQAGGLALSNDYILVNNQNDIEKIEEILNN